MTRRRIEPLVWLMFSGGGVMAAVVLPVLAFLFALAFVLLHTVTWFALTPQAMAVRVAGQKVPAFHIIAGQYTGLVVVSAFVFWLVTR